MHSIVHAPNEVLTTQAKTVTEFNKRLTKLIEEMKKTLRGEKNPKGVGLAAPQIGEPWRVFLTRPTEKSKIRTFINPEIIKRSDEMTDGVPSRGSAKGSGDGSGSARRDLAPPDNKLEGCLSIPGIWGKVKRSTSLTLRFQDEKGTIYTEDFDGFLATIIQHETDHTNGILYTQRVLEQRGKLFQSTKNKEGKEILDEIQV